MQNDLETRERKTGSPRRAAASGVNSNPCGNEIQHVIERAVVGACFQGTIRSKDGQAQPQSCENGVSAPVREPVNPHRKLPSINGAGCGTAAMAGMKRFIAVMDKVYAKVLSDGDFDFIGFMAARGLSPEEMLDLLEACAARLGTDWECDACGFVHVTVAMSRLQRILTSLGQENRSFDARPCEHSALFIVPHGETHLFSVNMVEERFRLKGWETKLLLASSSGELSRLLKNAHFELVCLAWLDSELKNQVESLLHTVRMSVNREQTCVIAGGSAAELNSDWLKERGVEKVCSNAQIAVSEAERHGANRNSGHNVTETTGSLLEPLRSA
ncbi:B12-binding domain-containing protein [Hoeflea sp.]|uniref:cobalamin B12-binding domain-containing protein n=1 Tax=Hoeflea sp. TaxID=1940281 RepID=UPI0037487B45